MPKFTRAQIRRRRRIAAAILVIFLLVVLGSCVAVLSALFGGEEGQTLQVRVAEPKTMTVSATADGARAHSQLIDGPLREGEAMGIDVAAHQEDIDWKGVASDGYTFAYIKATEGMDYVDPTFQQNWDGAQAAGLTVGAYHYFTLCSPGVEQAKDFLATVPVSDAALPPAIDLEFDGACDARPEASHAQAEIDDFLRIVEAAWGRRVVVYSSYDWRSHYGLPQSDGRPDWLSDLDNRPNIPDWSVWQLSFTGKVSGIKGNVDIDVLRVEQLREHSAMTEEERRALEEELANSPVAVETTSP